MKLQLAIVLSLAATPAIAQPFVAGRVEARDGSTYSPAPSGRPVGYGSPIASSRSAPPMTYTTRCAFDPALQPAGFWGPRATALDSNVAFADGWFADESQACPPGQGFDAGCEADLTPFECANCNAWLDFEKRAYFAYASGDSSTTETTHAYGNADTLFLGVEWLPFLSSDNDREYLRFGILTAFEWTHYAGNSTTTFVDPIAGRAISIRNGDTYGFVVGPDMRQDFNLHFIGGDLILSPSASVGATFEWTELDTEPFTGTHLITRVPLKTAGFDVGGYVQLALDLVLSDDVRIGAGAFFRFVPTDVMTQDGSVRTHLGAFSWISREF